MSHVLRILRCVKYVWKRQEYSGFSLIQPYINDIAIIVRVGLQQEGIFEESLSSRNYFAAVFMMLKDSREPDFEPSLMLIS